jgi:hypothetical protein
MEGELEYTCNGTAVTNFKAFARRRPTSTNPKLSNSNKNLILGPRLALDTKTD